jgi:hypothetical protein
MFSIKLKGPLLALAVTAGLLAVAGPASAQGGGADFTRFGENAPIRSSDDVSAYMEYAGSPLALKSIWTNGDGHDLNEAGPIGFTAPSEMDANANAFRLKVDDEVLASINYEPDVFW